MDNVASIRDWVSEDTPPEHLKSWMELECILFSPEGEIIAEWTVDARAPGSTEH